VSGWDELRAHAAEAMGSAYAPYSRFPVGAAGRTTDGRIVTGCNVENASYGLTLCAECGLVSELHRTGGGRLTEVVAVDRRGEPVAPCGRCRQLLFEAGGDELRVLGPEGPRSLAELLPEAFGPDDLTGASS
jgi:cytidine deaminase